MNLARKTIPELRTMLDSKEISVRELTNSILQQVQQKDGDLKSFLTIFSEKELSPAIDAAQKAIDEGKATDLTGIPCSVKDIFNMVGTRTTASAKILDNYIAPYESTVTSRLKNAGAIIVGKVNMDAWAHGSSTETSDYGPSHNPWDITRHPGGSSGGSASSVAGGQVPYSVGTETAGSIRGPAAATGITGFKGTYGRVSRYGVIAMGSSLDSPGPLTRTVEDAATIMKYISGHDAHDGTSIQESALNIDLSARKDLKGLKIGISNDYFSGAIQPGVSARVKEALEVMKSLGAEIREVEMLNPEYAVAVYTIVCRSEVSSNLARYTGTRYGTFKNDPVQTVYDVFMNNRSIFGFEAKRRSMTGSYVLSKGYYDKYYRKAQQVRTLIRQDYDKIFQDVDVFISPTLPNIAEVIGDALNNPLFGEMADLLICASAMAGIPGISVPVGLTENMPVGMQIIGPAKAEERIAQVAHVYQTATEFHKLVPANYE
ncbi:MAG: Asp-tRNA(Asn)/Glu-tRNA(Gln) amidotransferase subunit GatA [Candidatus Dojkabacteria bacterium]|nr:MAG: Asp-tRNA(Asn)/Glu-tRNA(Gln) amidotransferase subunit GatA [Candidatus Dojkabacteria bacterium]